MKFKLSQSQRFHLSTLNSTHKVLLSKKFKKGAEEHGGDLQDMPPMQLLDAAIDENIDQFVYLQTLKSKLTELANRKVWER